MHARNNSIAGYVGIGTHNTPIPTLTRPQWLGLYAGNRGGVRVRAR